MRSRRAARPTGRERRTTAALLVALAVSLAAYGWLASQVVRGGRLVRADERVAVWVAAHMPAWAEWIARPVTWLGGSVSLTAVCLLGGAQLLRHRRRFDALLLIVVTVGIHLVVGMAKGAYERPRPDVGSAIALPSNFSFPSGHAAAIAVFGLLGVLVAASLRSRRARVAAVAAGLVVGAAMGASRIVLNVHFVSDVLAGYSLGLAWLAGWLLVREAVRP